MKENFTTKSLDTRHRFDAWRESVCSKLIKAAAWQIQIDTFTGSFSYGSLGCIDIATHTSENALLWQRTNNCIRHHPNHDFYLGMVKSASGTLQQNGHCSPVSKGDLIIYDAARPFDFSMDTMAIDIVHLTRRNIEKEAPGISAMAGKSFDMARPRITSLKNMVAEAYLFNAEQEKTFLTEQFANTLFSMTAVSINLQKNNTATKPQLYRCIVNYLRLNLHDHELSIATIANAHHVSPRTVSRIFAALDTSPMNFLWYERLVASRKALTEGKARNITQVALDHGFSDMSHFSLAFRKAFGCSPSSLVRRDEGLPHYAD